MKKLPLILFFFSLWLISAFAATEFTATVMPSGGDYATLSAAEAGLENDLTLATVKVFSISAYTTRRLVDSVVDSDLS